MTPLFTKGGNQEGGDYPYRSYDTGKLNFLGDSFDDYPGRSVVGRSWYGSRRNFGGTGTPGMTREDGGGTGRGSKVRRVDRESRKREPVYVHTHTLVSPSSVSVHYVQVSP